MFNVNFKLDSQYFYVNNICQRIFTDIEIAISNEAMLIQLFRQRYHYQLKWCCLWLLSMFFISTVACYMQHRCIFAVITTWKYLSDRQISHLIGVLKNIKLDFGRQKWSVQPKWYEMEEGQICHRPKKNHTTYYISEKFSFVCFVAFYMLLSFPNTYVH